METRRTVMELGARLWQEAQDDDLLGRAAQLAFYLLLATFASRLAMAGVDLRTLQELAGWQTLAMVQRYAHLAPSHKAQSVERIALVQSQQIEATTAPVMVI